MALMQRRLVRLIVRDYIAAALNRQKPKLERYVAEHLRCPEAYALVFTEPTVTIREVRRLKIAPRFRADYPPVDVTVTMRVSITARTRRRGINVGMQTLALDVELDALGTAQGGGYDLEPRSARLRAWWG